MIQEEKPAEEEVPDIKVDAKTVKELRGTSGAGMMDCKKALKMCNNDLEEAAVRVQLPILSPCSSVNYYSAQSWTSEIDERCNVACNKMIQAQKCE